MALEVAGVRKRRGAVDVLLGVDLLLPKGHVLALLGPSGCGKTTLLRLLAGLDRCDAGSIRLDGTVLDGPARHVPPERRGVGYVPQEGLLFPHLDVAGNVAFGLGRAERRKGRVADALHLVGLDPEMARRRPHQLSGGQQQRVALARALAPRPRLVLLDEPFNGLDGARRRSVAAEVKTVLKAAGATAVLVTHDAQEAFATADTIAVILDGRVAQQDLPAALYRRPASRGVARLTGPTLELPGDVRGDVAETPLGTLRLPPPAPPHGRCTVLLRPEQVRPATCGEGVRVEVRSVLFEGSHARVLATAGDVPLDLRLAGPVDAGDQLWLAVEGPALAWCG